MNWKQKERRLGTLTRLSLPTLVYVHFSFNSFGLIWTDPAPYNRIVSITDEDCSGLGQ